VSRLPPASAPFHGAPLPRSFYDRDVLDVAPALVGAILVHRAPEGTTAGRIVECEAYRGPEDLASHGAGGRRTKRTEVMFGPPGRAYVFLLYGMHWVFDVVVGPPDVPHVVMVRAVEPVHGADLMEARRGVRADKVALTNGPGKLTRALGLSGAAYGADLCGERIFLVAGATRGVARAPRVNIDYAGAWTKRPWRFYERGSPFVSVPPKS
jgi:DNA-3-methyladenine glycosylase